MDLLILQWEGAKGSRGVTSDSKREREREESFRVNQGTYVSPSSYVYQASGFRSFDS